MPSSLCEQIVDLGDPALDDARRVELSNHLDTCSDCQDTVAALWEMESVATRWQEQRVPHWQRRPLFFEHRPLMPALQFASTAFSCLVLVLVLTQASVSTRDGLHLSFADDSVTPAEVDARLDSLKRDQDLMLATSIDRLSRQQAASNQLVLNTLLQTSREERQEAFEELMYVLTSAEDQRTEQTEASLRYLLRNQLRDRQEIRQLGEALQLVANEGGTL